MDSAFFSDLMASIAERGRSVLKLTAWPRDTANRAASLADMCGALLTGRGEASGLALASEILARYRTLPEINRPAFFGALADGFGPDPKRVQDAVARWGATGDEIAASEIHYASEPRRQELFRRLNRAPGGTAALVAMRADLFECMREDRGLAVVTGISIISSARGSIAAFSSCAGSTGRRPPRSLKSSFATRRCTRSATGTTCAGGSIPQTGAATRSSIRRWSTSP